MVALLVPRNTLEAYASALTVPFGDPEKGSLSRPQQAVS